MTDAHPYREGLPERPDRIARLEVDARGYPVPAFVEHIEGVPDHRIMSRTYLRRALRLGTCWVCGQPLGVFRTFLIGPMCCVNRVSGEPPSHYDCCDYSARACPFLSRPHAHRRSAGMPEATAQSEGFIARNPGVMALWTTRSYKPFQVMASDGQPGVLFEIGEPTALAWFTQGRPATRAEVIASIASGLPALEELAEKDGKAALFKLGQQVGELHKLLDRLGPYREQVTSCR